MATALGMHENIVPLLAPADQTSTNATSGYLDLRSANRASILILFGTVTSATATDTVTVTLEASTASTSNAGEEAIPFTYRVSAAIATGNTWGAATAATSDGFSLGASTVFDNMAVIIDIDPAAVAAKADAYWVRAVCTDSAAYSAMNVAMVGFIEPRYRQTTMITASVT